MLHDLTVKFQRRQFLLDVDTAIIQARTTWKRFIHAPPYLSDESQLVSDADRRLRSSAAVSFVVPRTRTRLGGRALDVAGPRIWNKLPACLRLREDFGYLRRLLKASCSIEAAALVTNSLACSLTYLLTSLHQIYIDTVLLKQGQI